MNQDDSRPDEDQGILGLSEGEEQPFERGEDHPPRWPTTDELRQRLTQAIYEAMDESRFVLIPAPTSSGKSYNASTTRWRDTTVTGGKPVIHLHYTTDSRKEAVEDSSKAGVEYRELLGRHEACETVNGKHDGAVATPNGKSASEWFNEQLNHRGNSLSQAHSHLEAHNDGNLPCQPCPSVEQWTGVPRDDDGNVTADVIHATHAFAHVPSLVDDANLFFDERPDFSTSVGERENDDVSIGRFQGFVTAWLSEIDAPVTTWEDFVSRAEENTTGAETELKQAITDPSSVDPDWFIEGEKAHSLAPALTEALYYALSREPDRNGRRMATVTSSSGRFEGQDVERDPRYNRHRITLIVGADNRPTVYWNVPELGNARSIICLDAWPSIQEWKQNIGDNLDCEAIVPTEKFESWRKFERGLEVVQIGDAVRPASTAYAVNEYTDPIQQRIVIDSLRAKYGDQFQSVIYPKKMGDQIGELLPDDFEVMTLGNVKSNNSFSGKRIGLVTNSIDPGDDYVLNLLAAQKLDAGPERRECRNCNGRGCDECEDGFNRKPGRGFTGPDSDKAESMLDGVRASGIAQAVGRWARSSDSPRALVFVRTSVVPPEMVDTTIDSAWKFTEAQRAIIECLNSETGVSAKEIAEGKGFSKRHVQKTLKRLEEYGMITRLQAVGENGADLFLQKGVIPQDGLLNLSDID